MNDIDWRDLQLFRRVARAGSLAQAAADTGVSAPTLGRRMQSLETKLGRALFERNHSGYALTPDGRALLDRIEPMATGAGAVEDWRSGASELPYVTISADPWTSMFLGGRIDAVWTPDDPFRLCFKTALGPADIPRREALIAIERQRPETGHLVALRLGLRAHAPFAARSCDRGRSGAWIALAREIATSPAERWTAEKPEARIACWANAHGSLYSLALAGAGRALLPCCLGDSDPNLARAGSVVGEVTDELWLVAHADERHRPDVRTLIDRLCNFFRERRALMSGSCEG